MCVERWQRPFPYTEVVLHCIMNQVINHTYKCAHIPQTPDSKEDLQTRLKALKKKFVHVRKLIHLSSHRMRQFPLGQDRYARQYWALPSVGGIIVEGVETSLDKNLQVLNAVTVAHDVRESDARLNFNSKDDSCVSEIDIINVENPVQKGDQSNHVMSETNSQEEPMQTEREQEVKVAAEENETQNLANLDNEVSVSVEKLPLPSPQPSLSEPQNTELSVTQNLEPATFPVPSKETRACPEEATPHKPAPVQCCQESLSHREENDNIAPIDHAPVQLSIEATTTPSVSQPQQPKPTGPQFEHHLNSANMSPVAITQITMEHSPTPGSPSSQTPQNTENNTSTVVPLQAEHYTPSPEQSRSQSPQNEGNITAPQRSEEGTSSEPLACSEMLTGEESKDGMEDQVTQEVKLYHIH